MSRDSVDDLTSDGLDPLTCASCRDELSDFVDALLTEHTALQETAVVAHLTSCAACAATYGGLVQLATAPQLSDLESSLLTTGRPHDRRDGLMRVWQLQLGLVNQFDDAPGVAGALSVLGMIQRRRGAHEDARVLHERAIGAWPNPSLSRLRSEIELAHLASESHRILDAVRHLAAASGIVGSRGDGMREQRIATLRSALMGSVVRSLVSTLMPTWLEPVYEASSEQGDAILVVNEWREVSAEVSRPAVDGQGWIHLAVEVDADRHELPAVFVLDLLFIPTGDVIWQQAIDADLRDDLRLVGGLNISAPLPGGRIGPSPTGASGPADGSERSFIPRRTCELRIWWPVESSESA
jgi:hypothetical protein